LNALRDTGVHGLAAAAVDRLTTNDSVGAAVEAGLAIVRVTLRSPAPDPWPLLQRVAELHRAWGAVTAFAPLPTECDPSEPSTGFADVKAVALSRLVLRDVPHIQVDWSRYGPKLAQVALLFGADDVDAVSPLEETGTGRRRAPLEEIRRNIEAASLTPVERDGRFGRREP
jgi:2-iminoacetate synthase ThiH